MKFIQVLISSATLLLLLLCLAPTNSNANINAQKLTLSLYYESLCPSSVKFITKRLYPLWKQMNGEQYLNLNLVPYGNAETATNSDGSFNITCQHGPDECQLNELQNCGLKYIRKGTLQLEYINCTLSQPNSPRMSMAMAIKSRAEECAKRLAIDYQQIRKCVKSDEGKHLHYLAGQRTDALEPPHQFVPWVVFDNVYINEGEVDEARSSGAGLLRVLCRKIEGLKPSMCTNVYF